ncbi:hypothetical protein BASA60_008960 [Batrachochytrium salamandrivorans]|nr:hypothetical protein BASA60_008960 [Batrachochytrium salamandrivorans]
MFGPALTLVLALASSAVIAIPTDDVKTATDFISKKLNLGANDFKVFNSYTDYAGISHVYGAHILNGARIANHQAAAHVKNGQVTFFSSSFGTSQHFDKRDLIISEPKATLDFAKASATASAQLGIPVDSEFEHALEYVEQPDGKIVYAYKLQLRNNPVTKWVEVWCDATTGKVIQAVDFVKKATSSPNGWTAGKATEGNNVITLTPSGRTTPATSDGVFDTQFDSRGVPGTDANIAAAAVNLFYLSNMMHDITYQYGFTEQAGNFQTNNFGRAEEECLDNGIAIHEYAHGVSVRLTGGPATSGCLATKEAGGMGEGWSDMMTLFILAKSSDTATTSIPMGTYVTGRQSGVRSRPYTTDMRVNPLTYGDLRTLKEVHDVGEVWASLLWEVYWSLVTKHGFSSNLYDANQSAGNIVTMRIIIGGMMLQQCNPTFLSARDAIVAADINHYKGANKCEILKAFAKRGLGSRATNNYNNDFSVPSECGGNAL